MEERRFGAKPQLNYVAADVGGNQGREDGDGVRFDLILAAGWAAHAKKLRLWGSRFEVRINSYRQLDCLSGKAPDFSGKDPL